MTPNGFGIKRESFWNIKNSCLPPDESRKLFVPTSSNVSITGGLLTGRCGRENCGLRLGRLGLDGRVGLEEAVSPVATF